MQNELKNFKKKFFMKGETKGITLIALIITVIILLILAGTAISIAINGGDIFSKSANARNSWNIAVEQENTSLTNLLNVLNSTNYSSGTNQNNETRPTIAIGNTQIELTPENVSDYIGKVVLNSETSIGDISEVKVVGRVATTSEVTLSSTTPTKEQITIGENTYNVSTQYRLFYVDFDNKYGDGAGTIYLKADSTDEHYGKWWQPISDINSTKLRQLNPMLYNTDGISAPSNDNQSMIMSAWLLDPEVWKNLKNSPALSSISSSINYVVGAPTLEMLFDSYNLKYNLTNTTSGENGNSERIRLEYYYEPNCDGYTINPKNSNISSIARNDVNAAALYTVLDSRSSVNHYGYWIASPGKKSGNAHMMYCYDGTSGLRCKGAGLDPYALESGTYRPKWKWICVW